ncbi:MAG TPA: MGMT family protein [Phycisphaerae bacterium]|nr:MGMT family protein [Phycisphaerae bacterium]
MQEIPDTHLRILGVIRRIPRGKVSTYGRIAALAGLPGRARLVGRILRESPLADSVPWHRVIGASGKISFREGEGPGVQIERLAIEGVRVDAQMRVELRSFLWGGPRVRGKRAARC